MEHTKQPTPQGWSPETWDVFNAKMEAMSKEELIEVFTEIGLVFEDPEDLEKEDIIGVADELDEAEVKEYFSL